MKEKNFTPVVIKGSAALALPPAYSTNAQRGLMPLAGQQGAPSEGNRQGAALSDNTQSPALANCTSSILVYAPRVKRQMTVLICETLSTFANVRKLMKVHGQRRFFGARIDAVVYGAGDALVQPGSLLEVERRLGNQDGVCYTSLGGAFRPRTAYLYWGSISRPAVMRLLSLYRANPGWDVKPFAPAYRYMLDAAYGRRLPAAPITPESSFFLRLEPHFTPMQQSTYRQVLNDQLRIPQGIVTERVLRKMSRKAR